MLATALPAKLTPADVVSKDEDDVWLFTEPLLQACQLFVNALILLDPCVLHALLKLTEWSVGLIS